MAAGMATLDELEKPGTFEGLLETSRTVASGIERRLSDEPAPVQVLRVGSVFSILFTDRKVRTTRDTLAADGGKRAALDAAVLDRGIFVKPGKPLYLSTAHDEGAVRQTLDAFGEAISDVAG